MKKSLLQANTIQSDWIVMKIIGVKVNAFRYGYYSASNIHFVNCLISACSRTKFPSRTLPVMRSDISSSDT